MIKSLIIQIEQEALDEINDAYDYYEDRKIGLGETFQESLNEAFQTILASTQGYTVVGNHRQFPMKNFPFVILFEATNTTLYIDAVFHTSRDPIDKKR